MTARPLVGVIYVDAEWFTEWMMMGGEEGWRPKGPLMGRKPRGREVDRIKGMDVGEVVPDVRAE